ncbi:SpoIIE family protein phosphatase [Nocardioides zeae]
MGQRRPPAAGAPRPRRHGVAARRRRRDAARHRSRHGTRGPRGRRAGGSTLLLYTDGLVERRGELLDEGIERLRAAVAAQPGLGPDALCDHVLAALGPFEDDDVAVLALRLD